MQRAMVGLACAVLLALNACTGEQTESTPPEATPQAASDPSPAADENRPEPTPEPEPAEDAVQVRYAPQEPPATAEDPAGLAAQITSVERVIRSDDASAHEVAAAGHLQQVVYRRLGTRPQWRDEALARVPEDLRDIVAAHVDASVDLARLITPQQQLPAWRIIEPPPAEELLAHYREAEAAFGVGWEYLAAIHLVETRMGRIQGTSPAGAQGPMQFMPGTWDAYGEGDINDPRDAILAAGRYLAANGAPATMENALFAYNRSDAYVRAIQAYAAAMRANPRTYRAYYHWQVYYVTTEGDRLLPMGYDGSS